MRTSSPGSRPRLVRRHHAKGFALVLVVWILGLILLMGSAITIGVRYRTRADTSLLDSQRAELAAESAINLAVLRILSDNGQEKARSFPLTCRLPGAEQVTISISEEAGKVDLNTSSPQTLVKLFVGLTQDRQAGERIAAAIVSSRPAPAAAPPQSAPPPGKFAVFKSVLELEAVPDITPELFRRALPLVTVRSSKAEPDLAAASEALRDTLGIPKNPTGTATGPRAQPNGEMTIRADVAASTNARFIREALVSLRPEHGRAFSVREWRHGDASEPFLPSKDLSPCFSVVEAQGT